MDNQSQSDYYRSVAKIRDSSFKPEEMSNLGQFYRDTAEGYRKRAEEASKEYQKWQTIWDDRFKRAEEAYLNQWKKNVIDSFKTKNIDMLRLKNDPSIALYEVATNAKTAADLRSNRLMQPYRPQDVSISAYNPDSPYANKKTVKYGQMFDEQGNRIDMKDIVKKDTSSRGNKFLLGQEGEQFLLNQGTYTNYLNTADSYQKQFDTEQADLIKRNEEARKKFIEEKQQVLSSAQASSYRGATYTEKPL